MLVLSQYFFAVTSERVREEYLARNNQSEIPSKRSNYSHLAPLERNQFYREGSQNSSRIDHNTISINTLHLIASNYS